MIEVTLLSMALLLSRSDKDDNGLPVRELSYLEEKSR